MPPIPPADIIPCGCPSGNGKAMCCSENEDVGRETERGFSSPLRSSGATGQMDVRDHLPRILRQPTRESGASSSGAACGASARPLSVNLGTAHPAHRVVPPCAGSLSNLYPVRSDPADQLTQPNSEPGAEGYSPSREVGSFSPKQDVRGSTRVKELPDATLDERLGSHGKKQPSKGVEPSRGGLGGGYHSLEGRKSGLCQCLTKVRCVDSIYHAPLLSIRISQRRTSGTDTQQPAHSTFGTPSGNRRSQVVR